MDKLLILLHFMMLLLLLHFMMDKLSVRVGQLVGQCVCLIISKLLPVLINNVFAFNKRWHDSKLVMSCQCKNIMSFGLDLRYDS